MFKNTEIISAQQDSTKSLTKKRVSPPKKTTNGRNVITFKEKCFKSG